MPRVSYEPDESKSDYVDDRETSLANPAKTRAQRRTTLMYCLNDSWANEDVGCIERVETKTASGWKMYPYRPPQS